jgi:hypothetical protein
MPAAVIETTVPASEQPQTRALDPTATRIGTESISRLIFCEKYVLLKCLVIFSISYCSLPPSAQILHFFEHFIPHRLSQFKPVHNERKHYIFISLY